MAERQHRNNSKREVDDEKISSPSIPWFLKSGWRLFGTVFLVVALLMGALAFLVSEQIQRELKDRAEHQNTLTARLVAPMVEEHFDSLMRYMESYAHRRLLDGFAEKKDAAGARVILGELVSSNPKIDRAFVTDARGMLWSDYPAAAEVVGGDFSSRDWFDGVSRSQKTYVSAIYQRAAPPQPYLVAIATPIRNGRHEIIGYLVGQHTVDSLTDWLGRVEAPGEAAVALIDNHGTVVSTRAGNGQPPLSLEKNILIRKALVAREGTEQAVDPISGVESFISYYTVAPVGWLVLVRNPIAAVTAPIAAAQRTFFGFALVIFLAMLALAFLWLNTVRRYHRALGESETRFRGLLESAPDAIIAVDREGRIVLVNSQAENWFGYRRDELLGRPVEILVPEPLREGHATYREHYVMAPHTRFMGAGIELNGRGRDGTEFPIEVSLSPHKTKDGLLVIAIIRDITQRKRSEQAHFEAQERYRALVKNLPVGVYRNTAGPEGRFLEANPTIAAMFEAESVEEFLKHPVSALYNNPAQRRVFVEKILGQGFVRDEELQLLTLKGRPFWAAVTAVMKRDEGGGIYFDGIIEDITERKEAEHRIAEMNATLTRRALELEAINKELEAFSYSVSHDLRTPLRAIDGFSHVLLEDYADKLDAEGRDYLERVRAATQRMALLIDDLLKLATVSRAELKLEDVNLSWMAEEIVQDLRAGDPHRKVDAAIAPDLRARGDARLLRIALENLLANAWKFTGRREHARIEFGFAEPGMKPVYRVRDNGVGFDMTYADKLFAPFQRMHDQHEFPGTGIGLATVQRIMLKHGGRIWVESVQGQGTSFYFTL